MKKYIDILFVSLVLATLAFIQYLQPLHTVDGPLQVIIYNLIPIPTYYAAYNVAMLTLVSLYLYYSKNTYLIELLSKKHILVFVLSIGVLVTITHPPVYDSLYYYVSNFEFINNNIDPYQSLKSPEHALPIADIPLLHNYPYGPIWLLFTSFVFIITNGSFIVYAGLLSLVSISCLLLTAYLINKTNPKLKTKTAIGFLLLSPVTLLFGINPIHPEIVATLFIISGFYFLKKKYLTLGFTLIFLATITKLSTLPVLLLTLIWTAHQSLLKSQFFSTIIRHLISITILVFVILVIFPFNPFEFNGIIELSQNEKLSYGGIGGQFALLLHYIIPQALQINILDFSHLTINLLYILIYICILVKIFLKKHPTLEQLIIGSYLSSTLLILMAGNIVKPWYYITPLAISLLCPKRFAQTSVYMSVFACIGAVWLNQIVYWNEIIQEAALTLSTISIVTVPFILIISTKSDTLYNNVNNLDVPNYLKGLKRKIILS